MRFSVLLASLLVLVAIAGVGGFFAVRLLGGRSLGAGSASPRASSAIVGETGVLGATRPDFALPDEHGKSHNIREWDGRVLLINFWATWCGPCLKEIPVLVKLQKDYASRGLQVVGVAIDGAANVRAFIKRFGIDYPTMHGQDDAIAVGKAYGNRLGALPYTAIVGRDRRIAWTHAGALTRGLARKALAPLF